MTARRLCLSHDQLAAARDYDVDRVTAARPGVGRHAAAQEAVAPRDAWRLRAAARHAHAHLLARAAIAWVIDAQLDLDWRRRARLHAASLRSVARDTQRTGNS